MGKIIGIGFGVLVLVGVGYAIFANSSQQTRSIPSSTTETQTSQTGAQIPQVSETSMPNSDSLGSSSYSGTVLAGSTSPYIAFTQADYEKATVEGKLIVLDFYASWCPTCRAEAPHTLAVFDTLDNPNVVGFRVNWKDDDTDADEKRLADDLQVPNQYVKIFMRHGQEIHRTFDMFEGDELAEEINSLL